MAAVTITAGSIIPASGYSYVDTTSAVALTRGQVAYLNSSSLAALAQCDGTTIEATVAGIVLQDVGAGQPVRLIAGGDLGMGVCLTAGTAYYVGATAGQIVPFGDLVSTNKVSLIGHATSTSNLSMAIKSSIATLA